MWWGLVQFEPAEYSVIRNSLDPLDQLTSTFCTLYIANEGQIDRLANNALSWYPGSQNIIGLTIQPICGQRMLTIVLALGYNFLDVI